MTKPSIEKITHSHTRMRLFDFEQGPDHEFEGLPHRTYSNSYGEGCYLCATLSEIKQLQAELAKKDAEIALAKYNEDTWYGRFMEAAQSAHDFQREKSVLTAERDALKAENLGYAKALLDLEAEVARLTADARRYQGATR